MNEGEEKYVEAKSCLNCKHGRKFHTESPCRDCFGENLWEPRDEIYTRENVFRGIDPGAPEGDQTNVRLDWGESGREVREWEYSIGYRER